MRQSGNGPTTEKSRKYGWVRRLAAFSRRSGQLLHWHGKCYDLLFVWLA
jgi:hypothetical protein